MGTPRRTSPGSEEEALRRRVEELESQLADSQKLHAIGSLAGGVAHDFNNLLTAILGYVSLLREDAEASSEVTEALNVIEKAADRASQLTAQLLGFARRGQPKRVRVDVHQTIAEVLDLLRYTIDKNIRLDSQLNARESHVIGDSGQMFQVLLNLALNARDAMPDGGTLQLATSTSGRFLKICVLDTGTGIPLAIRDRIFDPFFTTKDPGKGTGMGLTVVQSIVRAHGGKIEIECDPPPGTRFQLFLPLAQERTKTGDDGDALAPSRGKGSVLVIDDEEFVRQVAARMLSTLGYHAICLESPLEAIEYYRRRTRDIDIVLVDLVMPDLGGREVFERLREINPKARIVITSGYSQDPGVDALISGGARAFLQKPYRLLQLSEALSAAGR